MALEVTGKIHRIFETEQKSASFQAREFVLEVPDGNYPQLIKFQVVQDKCAMLDQYSEGDQVKVSFDLRGREWNGKFLTNLNAWRIERQEGGQTMPTPPAEQYFAPPKAGDQGSDRPANLPPTEVDDLPF
jgi:single-strand DNA-binding protein